MAYSFPGDSEVKVSAYNVGDLGSIPGSRRSPGEGNGNPLQYSCLENPMDWGAWWATVHRVAKSQWLIGLPRWLVVKNCLLMQETWETLIWSLGRKYPLEEGMATHSSTLAWRTPWTETLQSTGLKLQSTGLHKVRHDWRDLVRGHACMHTRTHTHAHARTRTRTHTHTGLKVLPKSFLHGTKYKANWRIRMTTEWVKFGDNIQEMLCPRVWCRILLLSLSLRNSHLCKKRTDLLLFLVNF